MSCVQVILEWMNLMRIQISALFIWKYQQIEFPWSLINLFIQNIGLKLFNLQSTYFD